MAGVADSGAHWSSRFSFIMASVGFAIGLGNIWRFPYIAGENGGAAFIAIYLFCVFCIGVPCLISELLIGRRGQHNPPSSMVKVAEESGRSRHWGVVGGMGIFAAFAMAITYSVVVGWVLWYLYKAVLTGFAHIDPGIAAAEFEGVLSDSHGMLFWTLVGNLLVGAIVFAGVKNGIERCINIMMPLMFITLIGLGSYNSFTVGLTDTIDWLFTPDFSEVDSGVLLAAIGQAFFSISVGMGGMMTYGAYLPRSFSIMRGAIVIVLTDTMVALLAGFAVFPAVFHYGLDITSGPGLIFQVLPVAFAKMPGGYTFAVLFFTMLAVAGITSMVGLFETMTSWVSDQFGISRHTSVSVLFAVTTVCSVVSVLSYNVWAEVYVIDMNFNTFIDAFLTKILLPLNGLLIAIFAGWFMLRQCSEDELAVNPASYFIWRNLLRFVAVPAIGLILAYGLI